MDSEQRKQGWTVDSEQRGTEGKRGTMDSDTRRTMDTDPIDPVEDGRVAVQN
jgi:hypothetical protein